MTMIKYVLSALAAVSSVAAATCSTSGTTTIRNQANAAAIATACATYTGSIAVATGYSGDLSFAGGRLQRIKAGDLRVVSAANVTTFTADRLEQIDGEFRLENAVGLFTLTIPLLSNAGSIYFSGLSSLAQVDGMTNIQQTGALVIQNTKLSTLSGFNLRQVSSFNINNNLQLQNVSLPLKRVPGAISIASNGQRVEVSFPNLQTAQSLSFRDCAMVSLPKLAQVNGSLYFLGNANLVNVSVPKLTTTLGGLSVNNNTNLQYISFPELETVRGALDVQKNPQLATVSFPKVQTIRGSFDAYGAFTKVSLPELDTVVGAFNVQTSKTLKPKDTCDDFKELKNDDKIKGDFQCADKQARPSDAGTTPTGDGAETVRTSNPAAPLAPLAYTGFIGVLAAMFGVF